MRRPFRTIGIAAVLLAGTMLGGCSGGADGDPVAARLETYSRMPMAGSMQTLKGALVVDDGCVYID